MFVPLLFMDLWLCLCLVEMKGILLKRLPKVPVLLLLLLPTLQPIWLLSLPFWRFSMESCRGLDQWLENQNLVLRYQLGQNFLVPWSDLIYLDFCLWLNKSEISIVSQRNLFVCTMNQKARAECSCWWMLWSLVVTCNKVGKWVLKV